MLKEAILFINDKTKVPKNDVSEVLFYFREFLTNKIKEKKPFRWRGILSFSFTKRNSHIKEVNSSIGGRFMKVRGGIITKVKVPKELRCQNEEEKV